MNWSRQNKHERSRLMIATAGIVVVFLVDIATGGMVRLALRWVAVPLSNAGRAVGTSIVESGFLATRHGLEVQNAELTQALAEARDKAAGFDAVEQENAQLRALANVPSKDALSPKIVTHVVSSGATSVYGTFYISSGTNDGVRSGMVVVTEGGFVVGKVKDVGSSQSLVSELFASGQKIDVIMGSSTISIAGRGGSAYGKIPHGITVRENDVVIAPSLSLRPVGIIGKVETDTSNSYTGVYVSLPVNPTALRFVYVVDAAN